jgi:hypothetical protein
MTTAPNQKKKGDRKRKANQRVALFLAGWYSEASAMLAFWISTFLLLYLLFFFICLFVS